MIYTSIDQFKFYIPCHWHIVCWRRGISLTSCLFAYLFLSCYCGQRRKQSSAVDVVPESLPFAVMSLVKIVISHDASCRHPYPDGKPPPYCLLIFCPESKDISTRDRPACEPAHSNDQSAPSGHCCCYVEMLRRESASLSSRDVALSLVHRSVNTEQSPRF